MKLAKSCWHSQVHTQALVHILKYNPLTLTAAFNEMDENHDGQVSEDEFIEVALCSDVLLWLYSSLGLYQSEKVLNNVDIKNHRCFRDFRMTSSLRVSKNAVTRQSQK